MNNPNFAIQKYVTGSDIKRVRKTLRLTQKKFAELVGVSKATMERWETKEDKITGPVVLLLKILHTPDDLLIFLLQDRLFCC